MIVLMDLMLACRRAGERCLVFSQSVVMLDCIQAFIDKNNSQGVREERITAYRLDGSTAQADRQMLGNRFNNPATTVHCFLISTNAGGVGLNLPAASRVIIVDSSWNPAADAQVSRRLGSCALVGEKFSTGYLVFAQFCPVRVIVPDVRT